MIRKQNSPLEHSSQTFVLDDLNCTIPSVLVEDILATRLHHHTTTDSIPWIRHDTRSNGDNLSNTPSSEEVEFLITGLEGNLGCVEHTKVGSTVYDDTLDRDEETTEKSSIFESESAFTYR